MTPLPTYTAVDRVDRRQAMKEAKRDWRLLMSAAVDAETKLTLLMRHTDPRITVTEETRALALAALRAMSPNENVFTMLNGWQEPPSFKALASAAEIAFTFDDKYTPRWAVVYLLVGFNRDQRPSAEVAASGRTQDELLAFLRSPRTRGYATRMGRFLRATATASGECFYFPLETHWGDLDEIGDIKETWMRCGKEEGIDFPQRHYANVPDNDREKRKRWWPPVGEIRQHGIRII
jgi:hypothetical protein